MSQKDWTSFHRAGRGSSLYKSVCPYGWTFLGVKVYFSASSADFKMLWKITALQWPAKSGGRVCGLGDECQYLTRPFPVSVTKTKCGVDRKSKKGTSGSEELCQCPRLIQAEAENKCGVDRKGKMNQVQWRTMFDFGIYQVRNQDMISSP